MGDANAKVGNCNIGFEDSMGLHGLGEMNDNGERFANLCSFNDLIIGGTVYPHKRIHKATWISPDGKTENQIDHFCISRKFRRSLIDVKVQRGADINSDHHLILARLKLRLKNYSNKKIEKRTKFNVNLLQSKQKSQEFQIELRNRFQPLIGLQEESVEDLWGKVKDTFVLTCKDILGEKSQQQSKDWISKESQELIEARRAKKSLVNDAKTRASKEKAQNQYSEMAKEVKRSIRKDKEMYINQLAEKAERAAMDGHMRTLYQITKTLTGKRSIPDIPIKDENGNMIFGKEEQLKKWAQHFERLLNRPAPENAPDILPARRDLPINCDPPSKAEIIIAVNQLNSGKASGPDLIPPEALKADVKTTADLLHSVFVKIWEEESFPKDWKIGHLVKLPKKGDLSNCKNYRGITLLSIPGKVFNRIILNRLRDATDHKLREEQAGFRQNRSCTDQIATLRIIVEQSLEWNSPLKINFIDFEKAFDSVDRESLWKIMRSYGIPQKVVNLVKNMYDGTNCRVLHDGQMSETFNIITGVRQGCMLSPFLFILVIDWLMKETTNGKRNGIQWTPWSQLDDLDFADDIALLSHSHQQLQSKTTEFQKLSKSIGLQVHPGKTKTLTIGHNRKEAIKINEQTIEEVESFVYLGSVVDQKGGTEQDIKTRIKKARIAFKTLHKFWKNRSINIKTKLRIFNSNVKSVLLYGCETWNTTQTCLKRLQTFINGCLRKILRIKWSDKVTNVDVWQKTEQPLVATEIGQRRWRWIGHTLRKPKTNITKHSFLWNPQGQRKRGRPRTTWRRSVEEEMRRSGYTWTDLKKRAQDRDEWRAFVRGLYPDKDERH